MNDIFADEVEKAGARIDRLDIDKKANLIRLMNKAQYVFFICVKRDKSFLNKIQSYTEFPYLKQLFFYSSNSEIISAVLDRSQLKYLKTESNIMLDILP